MSLVVHKIVLGGGQSQASSQVTSSDTGDIIVSSDQALHVTEVTPQSNLTQPNILSSQSTMLCSQSNMLSSQPNMLSSQTAMLSSTAAPSNITVLSRVCNEGSVPGVPQHALLTPGGGSTRSQYSKIVHHTVPQHTLLQQVSTQLKTPIAAHQRHTYSSQRVSNEAVNSESSQFLVQPSKCFITSQGVSKITSVYPGNTVYHGGGSASLYSGGTGSPSVYHAPGSTSVYTGPGSTSIYTGPGTASVYSSPGNTLVCHAGQQQRSNSTVKKSSNTATQFFVTSVMSNTNTAAKNSRNEGRLAYLPLVLQDHNYMAPECPYVSPNTNKSSTSKGSALNGSSVRHFGSSTANNTSQITAPNHYPPQSRIYSFGNKLNKLSTACTAQPTSLAATTTVIQQPRTLLSLNKGTTIRSSKAVTYSLPRAQQTAKYGGTAAVQQNNSSVVQQIVQQHHTISPMKTVKAAGLGGTVVPHRNVGILHSVNQSKSGVTQPGRYTYRRAPLPAVGAHTPIITSILSPSTPPATVQETPGLQQYHHTPKNYIYATPASSTSWSAQESELSSVLVDTCVSPAESSLLSTVASHTTRLSSRKDEEYVPSTTNSSAPFTYIPSPHIPPPPSINDSPSGRKHDSSTSARRDDGSGVNNSSSSDDEKSSSPGPSGEETETAPEGEGDDHEQDDSITRCVCDLSHDDGYMIQCDRCQVWQHVVCMGLSKENIPDEYLCEACSPRSVDRHKARTIQMRKRAELAKLASALSSSDSDDNSACDALSIGKSFNKNTCLPFNERLSTVKKKKIKGLPKPLSQTNKLKSYMLGASKTQKKIVSRKALGTSVVINNNLPSFVDNKEKKSLPKVKRRKSVPHAGESASMCEPASESVVAPVCAGLSYSDVMRGWVEGYEAAITNHYSPELRARVHAARINGISPHLRASVQGAVLGHRCKVVDNTDLNCLQFEKKVLVAGCAVSSGTALLEYQGKYLLWSQWCSGSSPLKTTEAASDRYLPFTLKYTLTQEGLCVAVDARTYGNEARFARRSCTPNAQVRHVVERGSLHLYLVALQDIDEGVEILLPLHTCNTSLPESLPPCPAKVHASDCCYSNNLASSKDSNISLTPTVTENNAVCETNQQRILSPEPEPVSCPVSSPVPQSSPVKMPTKPCLTSILRSPKKAPLSGSASKSSLDKTEPPTPQEQKCTNNYKRLNTSTVLRSSPRSLSESSARLNTSSEEEPNPLPKGVERSSRTRTTSEDTPKKKTRTSSTTNKDLGCTVPPDLPSVRVRQNSASSTGGKSPSKTRNRSPSVDIESSVKEEKPPPLQIKMTREEKKIAAYMKAFERLEKQQKRKEEMNKKREEERNKNKRSDDDDDDDDEDNSSTDESFRDRQRRKSKKNKTGGVKKSSRRRTVSGPVDSVVKDALLDSPPANARFPKTKKSLMNNWLNECSDTSLSPGGSAPLGSVSPPVGVPSQFLRSAPPTRRSSCATLAAAAMLSEAPCNGGLFGKKRWLRQAISEEPSTSCFTPDSPPSGCADYTTPLKKRRLARESVAGDAVIVQDSYALQDTGTNDKRETEMTEAVKAEPASPKKDAIKSDPDCLKSDSESKLSCKFVKTEIKEEIAVETSDEECDKMLLKYSKKEESGRKEIDEYSLKCARKRAQSFGDSKLNLEHDIDFRKKCKVLDSSSLDTNEKTVSDGKLCEISKINENPEEVLRKGLEENDDDSQESGFEGFSNASSEHSNEEQSSFDISQSNSANIDNDEHSNSAVCNEAALNNSADFNNDAQSCSLDGYKAAPSSYVCDESLVQDRSRDIDNCASHSSSVECEETAQCGSVECDTLIPSSLPDCNDTLQNISIQRNSADCDNSAPSKNCESPQDISMQNTLLNSCSNPSDQLTDSNVYNDSTNESNASIGGPRTPANTPPSSPSIAAPVQQSSSLPSVLEIRPTVTTLGTILNNFVASDEDSLNCGSDNRVFCDYDQQRNDVIIMNSDKMLDSSFPSKLEISEMANKEEHLLPLTTLGRLEDEDDLHPDLIGKLRSKISEPTLQACHRPPVKRKLSILEYRKRKSVSSDCEAVRSPVLDGYRQEDAFSDCLYSAASAVGSLDKRTAELCQTPVDACEYYLNESLAPCSTQHSVNVANKSNAEDDEEGLTPSGSPPSPPSPGTPPGTPPKSPCLTSLCPSPPSPVLSPLLSKVERHRGTLDDRLQLEFGVNVVQDSLLEDWANQLPPR